MKYASLPLLVRARACHVLCRQPGVGDIIIFHPREGAVAKPEWFEDDVFIKRIVATAGDTVEARFRTSQRVTLSEFRCS